MVSVFGTYIRTSVLCLGYTRGRGQLVFHVCGMGEAKCFDEP